MNIRRPNMTPQKTPMAVQPLDERLNNVLEVELGYTKEQAIAEAERCMNCPERYCAESCPAHTAIPEYIAEIRSANFEGAYEIIASTNPFACIGSRVCPYERQCESNCTRGIKSEPVAIGWLERFVCDLFRTESNAKSYCTEKVQGTVAIVGSGPAGLACALFLAKAGVQVTVYEKSEQIGGVLAWGIPSFILPKHILENLIGELRTLGVEFRTGIALGQDISLDALKSQYDAVFLAVGAEKPVTLSECAGAGNRVIQAVEYLAAKEKPLARIVTVFGGGSTAIDVARTALRNGAERALLVYRRTESEMPVTQNELAAAKDEGVEILCLASPAEFITDTGCLKSVHCAKMNLAMPDYPGGRRNVVPSGEYISLESDLAVLALGFENLPIADVAQDKNYRIIVDKQYKTSVDGVYAGGDAVTGPATVMKAVAAGKDAAQSILAQLKR